MTAQNAFDRKLADRIRQANSLVCVGLDPVLERLPEGISRDEQGVADFCIELINATKDVAAAFKPNLPFYLSLGDGGAGALRRIVEAVPDDIPVVFDCKVNDLGDTAKAWARTAFEYLNVDAIVVNPFMGEDAVEPYMVYEDKAVFVLVKTSNPGSGDFQDLLLADGQPLYQHVARTCRTWHENYPASVGMVVGATYPDQLQGIRELCPDQAILLPGLGAQGGEVQASVRAGVDANGFNLLCSSSRGIMFASSGRDFAEAAQREATSLRDEINLYRPTSNH